MSKEYYVSRNESDFFVHRPNGGLLTRAANGHNAKYICAELNRLLHRIPARKEDEMELFPPPTLEDAIKNTESAPKYDPCRKFREGDIVRLVQYKGRCKKPFTAKVGDVFSVINNESNDDTFVVKCKYGSREFFIDPAYIELVAPNEELSPYFVGESENSYDIFRKTSNGNQLRSSFWWKHNPTPELIELSKANAKEAAEAECAKLNAEYRKELK